MGNSFNDFVELAANHTGESQEFDCDILLAEDGEDFKYSDNGIDDFGNGSVASLYCIERGE